MKKIFFYMVGLAAVMMGAASCGDNKDISVLHELTPEEQAELNRQDSLKNAQLNRVNADLLLEYEAEITISQTAYTGGGASADVAVEIDKIAELFGLSGEEILSQIAEAFPGDLTGFAISGTTHEDVSGASNTNAPWGHWWDANGDITTWGDAAYVFAEFDAETGAFVVGQFPARLTDGQEITFIECLKYNEKRVAVVITVTAKAPGEITAAVVNTQQLSISITPRSDYTTNPLEFNLSQTLSDLGVDSMADVAFIGVNADGSYAREPSTPNGYWYEATGFVGAWGDNARVYTSYGEEHLADNQIGIGQMPSTLAEGDQLTVKYGFLANNKIEMLQIAITVIGYVDPETPPAGEPESTTQDITLAKPYSEDYATVSADIKELLRNAFKKTTYQIHQAIASGELKVYLGEVPEEAPTYTADVPGYWIKADGSVTTWGSESVVWCSVGHSETELYLYGGNHPDATGSNTVSIVMIITYNGVAVTLSITFSITAPEE
ncbi:MAG: DUF4859 domain-containing protein [Prevotellaceae bacterium]|jgi:hypothetical protein|nr:DUF4859 domain-containing protein [Prevotellaceae bacterium]